jgi:hypothetical protein
MNYVLPKKNLEIIIGNLARKRIDDIPATKNFNLTSQYLDHFTYRFGVENIL